MPFQLTEVVLDQDLGLPAVTILRTYGKFLAGAWTNQPPVTIQTSGVVTIADAKMLQQFPEGDRVVGALIFVSPVPIYTTNEKLSLVSDQIAWHENNYRVKSVARWQDFGFWLAIVERMTGS